MVHLSGGLSSRCAAQVYLGKWHSSEVAIKCLNPSLFFSGSDGTASKAAMADLLREADLLASLRHPNVVWVYGVVLPRMVRACLSDLPCMDLPRLVWPRCLMPLREMVLILRSRSLKPRSVCWGGFQRLIWQSTHSLHCCLR